MTTNGSYVSRAEMREALDPMREDIGEIKNDVKALLLNDAARSGANLARNKWIESRRFLITAAIAVMGALMASTATLVWLAVGG